jgi:hypothetical protein
MNVTLRSVDKAPEALAITLLAHLFRLADHGILPRGPNILSPQGERACAAAIIVPNGARLKVNFASQHGMTRLRGAAERLLFELARRSHARTVFGIVASRAMLRCKRHG